MGHQISANNRNNSQLYVNIDTFPDNCPVCHKSIAPMHIMNLLSGNVNEYSSLELLCRCPRQACGQVFIAIYKPNSSHNEYFYYKVSVPSIYLAPSISEDVKKISPTFYSIYSQAHQAESLGLKEICGAGYRKALEFLVKDFLLSKVSKITVERQVIVKTSLSQCIELYIEDSTTKQIAKRAVWLGNDETHYERKWNDKDLSDLKKLIHLTVNAIDSKIVADDYIENMKEV